MEKSPWITHSSKCIYENAWIELIEDQVTTPSGTAGIYGKVCMKNKAIGIIPIDDDGNTWLVGQYRYMLNDYSWEIPMGGCPAEESPVEAAKRELLEETGITAKTWTQIAMVHPSNSVTDEEGYVFVAKNLSFQSAKPDETEDLTVKKILLSEAVDMAMNGDISDAISVIGLLKIALGK